MKKRKCTICVAKTKALISFAVTAKLICAFDFPYADWLVFQRGGSYLVSHPCDEVVSESYQELSPDSRPQRGNTGSVDIDCGLAVSLTSLLTETDTENSKIIENQTSTNARLQIICTATAFYTKRRQTMAKVTEWFFYYFLILNWLGWPNLNFLLFHNPNRVALNTTNHHKLPQTTTNYHKPPQTTPQTTTNLSTNQLKA